MNKKIILLTLFLSYFLLFLIPPVRANNGEVLICNEATTPPTIDGSLDDEWDDAYHNIITLVGAEEISPIDVYVKNDWGSLYIALRIPDPSKSDLLVLRFEGEQGPWDAKNSRWDQEPWDMFWDGDGWENDTSTIDVLAVWGWHTDHWIVEWKIPLNSGDPDDMNVNAGETIKMGVRYGDASSYTYPSHYNYVDSSTWADLVTSSALTRLPLISSNVARVIPTIDGILDTGWNDANHHEITLYGSDNSILSSVQVYIMNDRESLYLGFWIPDDTQSTGDILSLLFDQGVEGNDYDGELTVNNEDGKCWSGSQSLQDFFYNGTEWSSDLNYGGTLDGKAYGSWISDHWEIEIEIPLSSGDHLDLDVTTGNTIGLLIQYREEESDTLYYFPQGADTKKTWSWCDLLTPLYVEIDDAYVGDERVDVGAVQTVGLHAIWANNGSDVNNGWLYINGTESITNETGWVILTEYSSVVQKRTWRVSAVNCNGITTYLQTTANPTIIWDRVQLNLSVVDDRIDVTSFAPIILSGAYEYDGTSFTGSISLNDTYTQDIVGKYGYRATQIIDSQYGLSIFSTNEVSVIFDMVNVTLTLVDDRIDVGSDAAIDFIGVYEYDESPFEGTIFLNDATIQFNVGKYVYEVDGITDLNYGLSAFISNNVLCIFDRVNIHLSVKDSRIDVEANAIISWSGVYEYDDTSFIGSMTLNDTQTSYSTMGHHGYRVASIVDPSYSLTVFTSNSISVIFDKILITLSIASDRIYVGANATINWVGVYEYDASSFNGSITLNSTQTLSETIGKRGYTVLSISDPTYGLTHYTSNTIFCIWDRIKIIEGGVTWYTVWFKAVTEYDGEPIDVTKGTLFANGQSMAWSNNRNRWEYTVWLPIEVRITDVTYPEWGLTVINDTVGVLIVPIWMQWWFMSTISTVLVLVLVFYFLKIYPQKKKDPYNV